MPWIRFSGKGAGLLWKFPARCLKMNMMPEKIDHVNDDKRALEYRIRVVCEVENDPSPWAM